MSTVQVLTAERSYEVGLPAGGVAGQVPVKQSADDFDTAWQDIATQLELDNAIAAIHANEFRDDLDIYARYGDAQQVGIGAVGPTGESAISFQAGEIHLYRSAPNTLVMDSSLILTGFLGGIDTLIAKYSAASQVRIGAEGPAGQAGFTFGVASDVNLYRQGVDVLRTDDTLAVGGNIAAESGTAQEVQLGWMVGGYPAIVFGSAGDVNIYRYAADVLKTDDSLVVAGAIAAGTQLSIPANVQFNVGSAVIENNGSSLDITGGSADIRILNHAYSAVNMTIYDNGETVVERNDLFGRYNLFARYGDAAQVHMGAAGPSSQAGLTFGVAQDTNIYRHSAYTLKTDSDFSSLNVITAKVGQPEQVSLAGYGPGGKAAIAFGSALDTSLYRDSALVLRSASYITTDAEVIGRYAAAGETRLGGRGPSGEAGISFGIGGGDTILYRANAGQLRINGHLTADASVYAHYGSSDQMFMGTIGGIPGITFGIGADTDLYRNGAGTLKTDGNLQVAGYVTVGAAVGGWALNSGGSAGAGTTGGVMSFGTGAPNNASGANGDYYFRGDGGAGTRIYHKEAGAWVGIV